MKVTRRDFVKLSAASGAGLWLGSRIGYTARAFAIPLAPGLSDPAAQPKFSEIVPNALDPGFIYNTSGGKVKIAVSESVQYTGLVAVDPISGEPTETPLPTTVWGYGDAMDGVYTWPGRTFQVRSNEPLQVKWENRLIDEYGVPLPYLLTGLNGRSVVDTSLHWAYSLHGYDDFTIERDGVPIVPHVHGGHNDFQYDGNPEFFFSPNHRIRGPQWVEKKYVYENDQPAGTVWYHDHALGITRLNVYAGMAGFFIIRDDFDTGLPGNPLALPAWPYEAAFAIQDKMFKDTGELFYPAFPGDPFYDDFITGEGAILPPERFPGGGPTGLAEFFGDHMVVNGKLWPKMDVEPRNYRLRFLNGCDSRFLVAQFFEVPVDETDFTNATGPIPFTVIGSDQGLSSAPVEGVDTLVMETGSRYDIIFDFKTVTPGSRVIMKNIGGDSPFGFAFGDDLEPEDLFPDRQTDRIMAFDVVEPLDASVADVTPIGFAGYADSRVEVFDNYDLTGFPDRVRKVALFEGMDEFGRLQPILGTAEPATDYNGDPVYWPEKEPYISEGLTYLDDGETRRQMEGAIAWHSPTTENPALGDMEEWHIANVTGDAHPVHLHLVHFEVVGRSEIKWDSNTIEDGDLDEDGNELEEDRVIPNALHDAPEGDGTYLVEQPVVQHNGDLGNGFRIVNLTEGAPTSAGPEYVDADLPKDMVAALPSQITKIRAKFDKPGRYVWHCHILSHEDHEMMRVLHVGPGADAVPGNPPGLGGKGQGRG
jgi:FtsP/CotA-like multicopper oxidase with cupredoxin domain